MLESLTGIKSGVVTPKDKTKLNPLAVQVARHISKSVQVLVFPSVIKGSLRSQNSQLKSMDD